jgi:ribosomal protein S20
MPTIPQYNRSAKLTTQAPSAKRDESFAGQTGQAIQGLGQALGQVAERMQKIQLLKETTKSKRFAENKMADLYMEAQKDPDVWDIAKYNKKAKEIKSQALDMVSDPIARQQLTAQLDNKITQGKLKIFNLKYKQQMQDTAKETLGAMSDSFRIIKNAKDPKIIASEKAEAKRLLEELDATGLLTPTQYNAKKDYIEEDLEVERLENLARTDPQYVEDFIQSVKQNKSYDLPANKANEILELAGTVKKYRLKKRDQERQIEANNIQDKWTNIMKEGELTEAHLEELEEDRLNYPEIKSFIKEVEQSITNPKTVAAKTESNTLDELSTEYSNLFIKASGGDYVAVDEDSFHDVAKFRRNVVKAYNKGQIPYGQMRKWLESSALSINEQTKEYALKKYKSIKKGIDNFSWWSKNFVTDKDPSQIKAILLERFLGEDPTVDITQMTNEEIDKKTDKIIKEFLREEYPELMGQEDIPNAIRNEEGKINKIYKGETNINPDEEYEEVMGEPDEYGYSIGQTFEVGGKKYRYIGNNQAEEIK